MNRWSLLDVGNWNLAQYIQNIRKFPRQWITCAIIEPGYPVGWIVNASFPWVMP